MGVKIGEAKAQFILHIYTYYIYDMTVFRVCYKREISGMLLLCWKWKSLFTYMYIVWYGIMWTIYTFYQENIYIPSNRFHSEDFIIRKDSNIMLRKYFFLFFLFIVIRRYHFFKILIYILVNKNYFYMIFSWLIHNNIPHRECDKGWMKIC